MPTTSSTLALHAPIFIEGNSNFTAANGVTGGSGTLGNPYIIEGWEINASTANGVEIRDTSATFVLRHVYVHSFGETYLDILLENVAHARVDNATTSGGSAGLDAEGANDYVASNNTISGASTGLVCRSCTNTTASYNNITGSTTGMLVEGCPGILLLGNAVSHSLNFGLRVDPPASPAIGSGPLVMGNVFTHNGEGAYLYSPQGGVVEFNVASYNGIGIGLPYYGNDTLVRANQVAWNSQYGLRVQYSANTTIEANNLSHNGYGVYLQGDAGTRTFHNNFGNNAVQASDSSSRYSRWNLTYPGGGNFWSDYAGKDNCSGPSQTVCTGPDGFGDTPYPIVDSTEVDHYPLMQPYPVPTTPTPPRPLSVGISASPANGTVPLLVTFASHVEGGVPAYLYNWSFGDGSSSTLPNPTHTFAEPGNWTATLAVSDAEGHVATDMRTISAYAAPGVGGQAGAPLWVIPSAIAVTVAALVAIMVWKRKQGDSR